MSDSHESYSIDLTNDNLQSLSNSDKEEYVVEKIITRRIRRGGIVEYLVKWDGYPEEENTWEPITNLANAAVLVAEYNRKMRNRWKLQLRLPDKSEKNGFEKGQSLETIVGATEVNGSIMFAVKWKNRSELELISNEVANVHCPQELINFYEKHCQWKPMTKPGDSNDRAAS